MPDITYQDFKIIIQPDAEETYYRATMLGPGGSGSTSFSAAEIRQPASSIAMPADSPNQAAESRPERAVELIVGAEQLVDNYVQPLTLNAAIEFGKTLFRAIFKDDVYVALRRSLDRMEQEGSRLRLQLNLTSVPELAVLPWEFLCDDRAANFFAQSVQSPIVRYLDQHVNPPKSLTVSGPLRVLVMVAHLPQLPQLDVEKEWFDLKEAVRELEEQGLLEVERLDEASVSALLKLLTQRLTDRPYHVFHFIGHGVYNRQLGKGRLLVKGANNESIQQLSAERLSALLREQNRSLRLVVLNACEGARTSFTDTYRGVAQSLFQQGGIPAVIAMQYKITDKAAITFTRQFYSALAAGYPVEAALSNARLAIYTDENDVEWATPVLYLNSESGQLFNVSKSRNQRPVGVAAHPLNEHYEDVINALIEGKLIPFLGLDVNLYGRKLETGWEPGSKLPCNRELTNYLAKVFSYPDDEVCDLVSVSQYAVTKQPKRIDLYDSLSAIFSGTYDPTPLHYFLAQLPKILRDKGYPQTKDPLRHRFVIVTSTYDNLLESAFETHVPNYHVVSYVTLGEQSGKFTHTKFAGARAITEATMIDNPSNYAGLADLDPIILKLPGAVEPFEQRFAITEDQFSDYLTYRDLSGLLPPQLKGKLKGSHHLFLGSNLRDWHLRALLYRVWESRRPQRDSWAIHPQSREIDKDFWKASGVKVIEADFENYLAGLNEKLRSIAVAGEKV